VTRSKTQTALIMAAVLQITGWSSAASAQTRADQPVTLRQPPPRADPALIAIDNFRRAYANAGAPRVVILWNQEFSEEVASEYEDRQTRNATFSEQENETTEETSGPAGSMAVRDRNLLKREKSEDVAGTRRVRNQRDPLIAEPVRWQMEQNFQQTLVAGGVRIIDRNMIMRRTALNVDASERANVQAIEMAALAQSADWLVEILMAKDDRAPDGVSFRINVRDLRSDRLLTNFITVGQPRPGPLPLVAGPGGFIRATAPKPGPSQVASQIAIELMESMLTSGFR